MSAIQEWFGGYGAMFRYLQRTYGEAELECFFDYLSKVAYSDITPQFRSGGLEAIEARYCKNFRMDGGENAVLSSRTEEKLTMKVNCPAYFNAPEPPHPDYETGPSYCGWCRRLNEKILQEAGYDLALSYDGCGHCRWEVKKSVQE